ncbi:N-acetylglucosamine-1-phosphate transferase [Cryptosporidium ubiquitum]|uniref:UDP-N-acetylglucosamine--dolichyl-phosphate N-acetylglucosaminephosphotransferase n=1 Tax=Cryptosporidium ubiquitum TaxID=857276 RepID=A0A1J4MMH4_9CRYT|nr:N-acetylglucosamine-1-phosphate transferase [Cryptosporidium ubiquitum]OII75390.1 N-acetylglucosamine-1-phosphate transferase [Cryptosporidium ubiquitum]
MANTNKFHKNGEFVIVTTLIILLVITNISLFKTSYFFHTLICSVSSLLTYVACSKLIPTFGEKLLENGLFGIDINKKSNNLNSKEKEANISELVIIDKKDNIEKKIPESLGIVPASMFMITAICNQILFSNDPVKLLEYNSGLLSICMMIFLGFVDDVLNLKWRYKMVLPVFAALPTLVSYNGGTQIIVPLFLTGGDYSSRILIDLGYFYYLYMLCLTVFCTNSINIYAGVNGLEVGQSIIISASIIVYNIIEMLTILPNWQFSFRSNHHFFSILLLLPFTASSLSLFHFNRYPSLVFVGDTYTYFAGACFAIVSILGHFSKTLLLFFLPQILNFIISTPQLFGIVYCPRHRVPKFNEKTGKLESSKNLTLLNLVLEITGPLTEKQLVYCLLIIQTTFLCLKLNPRQGIDVTLPCLGRAWPVNPSRKLIFESLGLLCIILHISNLICYD